MNRLFTIIFLTASYAVMGQSQAPIANIDASKTGPPISPFIYGQFLEHAGSLIYGALWCEMLDDRKFYYDVMPKPAEDPSAGQRSGRGGFGPMLAVAMSGRDGGILLAPLIPS